MRVVVVGPGLMGAQIGVEYALGGHDVTFLARDAAKAARDAAHAAAKAEREAAKAARGAAHGG